MWLGVVGIHHTSSMRMIIFTIYLISISGVSRLKTNIRAEFMESIYALCAHQCAAHRFCVAINYKKYVDEKTPNCQLTNTTKPMFEQNVEQKNKIWTFQKINVDRSMLVRISTFLSKNLAASCSNNYINN